MVLQECSKGVTRMLQRCYRCYKCYVRFKCVTRRCYRCGRCQSYLVTNGKEVSVHVISLCVCVCVLQVCYEGAARMLQGAARMLQLYVPADWRNG
jgi:hypothetical protein